MEAVSCDLCGHDDAMLMARGRSYGYPLNNVICRNCTLVYQNPRMTAEELRLFYAGTYSRLRAGSRGSEHSATVTITGRIPHIVRFCRLYLTPGTLVLEVGCGTGELLAHVRDRYACRCVGLEPSPDYRRYAEERHRLAVVESTLEEFEPQGMHPELVIMSHVLEHTPSPRAALAKVRRLLAPGAVLYIEVPNLLVHQSFSIPHTYSFHAKTLEAVLAVTGFEVVERRSHGYPAWPRIPYYLSYVARAGEARPAVQFSGDYRRVVLRRKVGRTLGILPEIRNHVQGTAARLLRRILGPAIYRRVQESYWRRRNPSA